MKAIKAFEEPRDHMVSQALQALRASRVFLVTGVIRDPRAIAVPEARQAKRASKVKKARKASLAKMAQKANQA